MTEDILDEDIFDENIIIDANNEIVDTTAFNDYMDLAQIDDFDYMNDEEEVEGNNKNTHMHTHTHTQKKDFLSNICIFI